jgi:transcription elongation factor GreB
MNKAFTKEDDSDLDDVKDEADTADSGLAIGAKNYMTPQGAAKLRGEYSHLKHGERPEVVKTVTWAAGNGDRSENADYQYGKRRLREIDRRLRYLSKRLESAEIIDPATVQSDRVQFGATVSIRDEDDKLRTYSIVGVDEIDVAKGKISWLSPLAAALMKAREGDVVTFRFPRGVQEIEVVSLRYLPIPE